MAIHAEDRELVRRLMRGDRRAFDAFFDDNYSRLYRFALVRLDNDQSLAEEVAQTALSRALEKIASYRAEAQLFTWLCTICRNEISDQLRRLGRHRRHIVLIEDLPEVSAVLDSLQVPASEQPERWYEREESVRLIQVALDRLPAKYGDVLEWKYVEGHSVKDIAARLELGQEAAQSLLARARRAFAEAYSTLVDAAHTHAQAGANA